MVTIIITIIIRGINVFQNKISFYMNYFPGPNMLRHQSLTHLEKNNLTRKLPIIARNVNQYRVDFRFLTGCQNSPGSFR